MSTAFSAKQLAAILVVGALLFIAVGAYVISQRTLPPADIGSAPRPNGS